jgi:hypothetical protein
MQCLSGVQLKTHRRKQLPTATLHSRLIHKQ